MDLLTFELRGRRYAVELAVVREVVTLGPVTRVPGAPGGLLGVAAVRGRVLPVADPAADADRAALANLPRQGDEALWIALPDHDLLLWVGRALEVLSAELAPGEHELWLAGAAAPVQVLDMPGFVQDAERAMAEAANHYQVQPFSVAGELAERPTGETR